MQFKQSVEKEKPNDTTFPLDDHYWSPINDFKSYDLLKSFNELEDLTIEVRFVWYFMFNLESPITKEVAIIYA